MPTRRGQSRRPGRPPAAQAPLTSDRILDVALTLVDDHGLEALSMRKLAHCLDVDPMSIYHHLPNKAAVISGLVERVFSQMRLPAPGDGDWAAQVRAWVHAYHDLTRTHPHLVLQIVSDPAAVARAGEIIDQPLQDALTKSGLPTDRVAPCVGLLVDYINGYALAEAAHPHTTNSSTTLPPTGFETGLDVILLGIQTLATQTTRP